MSYIFISYSHKDKEYVHRLQEALQNEGFDFWIDDRIDYGIEWPKEIQKQLDSSDALILVMTPRSFDSFWVQNELDRARENGIPIFPLLLEGKQWLAVQVLQYVDVRDKSLPPEKFYKRLANVTPRKKTKDDLDELKKLESQAIQFELLGKFSDALRIYYKIKRIDPLFPGIDNKIRQLEYENST